MKTRKIIFLRGSQARKLTDMQPEALKTHSHLKYFVAVQKQVLIFLEQESRRRGVYEDRRIDVEGVQTGVTVRIWLCATKSMVCCFAVEAKRSRGRPFEDPTTW